MRFVDLMLNFPRFFLLLTLIALLRPSIWVIMAVIGFTGWMGLARLVRGEILSLREREFVQGARALGAADARIMVQATSCRTRWSRSWCRPPWASPARS